MEIVGAEWGKPSPYHTAQQNGYRHDDLAPLLEASDGGLTTSVGTSAAAIAVVGDGQTTCEFIHPGDREDLHLEALPCR